MDAKSIEMVLHEIIDIDKKTDAEVQKLRGEIEERKSQLKNIISEIEENSNTRQVEHGKKMYERILNEAVLETEKIQNDSSVNLTSMEKRFEENKAEMIKKALSKLSVDKWGS
ncbi:hypothetical protein QE109_14290 [Fusibacter bizertensis]|jgi:hypothetical protein|uniref:ATPase n=1 Tax=Fusibacter bizertensis TaxID=1488331 RepID=A0ABT6NFV8_9FIRM|nr:hypothetical protein [Fusibacter bizertensis]MDH8679324.1 hypothetical protein [Fusibacter bizertensis]